MAIKIMAYFFGTILLTALSVAAYNLYLWLRQRQTENTCYRQTLTLDAEAQQVSVERQRHLLERDRLTTEAQRIEPGLQVIAAARPRMHRDPRRLVDDQHQPVAVEDPIEKAVGDHVHAVTPPAAAPGRGGRRSGGRHPAPAGR